MLTFAFIIPTRNRSKDIGALLMNIQSQSIQPNHIIVVDSSDVSKPELAQEFPDLPIEYHAFREAPSAAAQRNAGLAFVDADVDLVGFVDDDILFEKDAMKNMLAFWNQAPKSICGAAFNLIEDVPDRQGVKGLKGSALVNWLGLYGDRPGAVAPSGWHGRIGQLNEDTQVEWLSTSAVLWQREVLAAYRFDPFFQGYSYLEDLDFSYGLSRKCGLMVVASARFEHHHHHQQLTPEWYLDFGRMEVRNRLYFVRKHGLSVPRCYLGLLVRMAKTLYEVLALRNGALLSRARGNLAGLYDSVFRKARDA